MRWMCYPFVFLLNFVHLWRSCQRHICATERLIACKNEFAQQRNTHIPSPTIIRRRRKKLRIVVPPKTISGQNFENSFVCAKFANERAFGQKSQTLRNVIVNNSLGKYISCYQHTHTYFYGDNIHLHAINEMPATLFQSLREEREEKRRERKKTIDKLGSKKCSSKLESRITEGMDRPIKSCIVMVLWLQPNRTPFDCMINFCCLKLDFNKTLTLSHSSIFGFVGVCVCLFVFVWDAIEIEQKLSKKISPECEQSININAKWDKWQRKVFVCASHNT